VILSPKEGYVEDEGNAPSVYGDNDKIIYRASALGGCLVALAAARRETDRAEWKSQHLNVFEGGNMAEEQFFERNADLDITRKQERVELPVIGNIVVVGHIDGWYYDHVLEIKSQSEEEYDKWTEDSWDGNPLWVKYGWQISAYMLATDRLLAWVCRVQRDSDKFELRKVGILHSKAEIVERVLEVESLALDENLKCTDSNFFCQYPQLHQGLEPTDDPELEALVDEYLHHNSITKGANKALSVIKEKISNHLDTTACPKVLLMSGRQVTKSVVPATKDHMVKGSKGYTRITITDN
jgi:hypothetical protein